MVGTCRDICVVDDDEDVRDSLDSLLQSASLSARTFSSAEEALACPDVAFCDCLITDYQMAELTGLDLAERLRAANPSLPVLLITAVNSIDVTRRAERVGVRHLRKPFDGDVFLDMVRLMLASSA
jgi:FixJ family two-component response regulator